MATSKKHKSNDTTGGQGAMLSLREVVQLGDSQGRAVEGAVTLSFDQRRRSRLRVSLDDGREAALLLPRGTVLRDGHLLAADGQPFLVVVRAAAQSLSIARTADPLLLARAAYHLGNRHVPLELGSGWVAYEHDHVLDDMVRALGLEVAARVAPFEPEVGGYGGHGRSGHGGDDGDGHGHSHTHAHGHRHGTEPA